MDEPTREEIGDLLRRLVDTAVETRDRAEALETQLAERDKACVEWSEVSQRNYQRAKAAEQALATARADALREAAYIARNACLVPPDGGNPTEQEVAVCDEAYRRILALIDQPAPAPKPSLDDVVVAALKYSAAKCDAVMGDMIYLNVEAKRKDGKFAAAISAAASDPATIAAIIKTAGGKKDE
jgi:hypothetical protein